MYPAVVQKNLSSALTLCRMTTCSAFCFLYRALDIEAANLDYNCFSWLQTPSLHALVFSPQTPRTFCVSHCTEESWNHSHSAPLLLAVNSSITQLQRKSVEQLHRDFHVLLHVHLFIYESFSKSAYRSGPQCGQAISQSSGKRSRWSRFFWHTINLQNDTPRRPHSGSKKGFLGQTEGLCRTSEQMFKERCRHTWI